MSLFRITNRPSTAKPSPPTIANYGRMYFSAKQNANRRAIPFELTREDFDSMVRASENKCCLSGIPFSFVPDKIAGKRRPFAPSLDRINCDEGYNKENCRLVCVIVNIAMNEWGETPLIKMSEAICRKQLELKAEAQKILTEGEDYCTTHSFLAEIGSTITKPAQLATVAASYCRSNLILSKSESVKVYQRADLTWAYREVKIYPKSVYRACMEIIFSRSKIAENSSI